MGDSMSKLSAHFARKEFACRCGCGFDTVDAELLDVLESVREEFGLPIRVTSGCRCHTHNAREGGGKNSQHLFGRAADIHINGVNSVEIAKFIDDTYGDKYGVGVYSTWVHIDTRSNGPARWG